MRGGSAARAGPAAATSARSSAAPMYRIAAACLGVGMALVRSPADGGALLLHDDAAGGVAVRLPVGQVGAVGVLAHGPGDEIALGEVAALHGEEVELGRVLHALGEHAQVEALRHR